MKKYRLAKKPIIDRFSGRTKKVIVGSKGHFAIINEEYFDWVNTFKWFLSSRGYATRVETKSGLRKNIHMHQLEYLI